MEDNLQKITSWLGRGTLVQLQIEVGGHLASRGYTVEREGDTLSFYRTRKEGGFLGFGGRLVREPVMKITKDEEGIQIPSDPLDPEFVWYLASGLRHH